MADLHLKGILAGHGDYVTSIATTRERPNTIVSSSRDKSLIVWNLERDAVSVGAPQRRLEGHSHFIEDVVISSDGDYALSCSWDSTLRLWDLNTGTTTRTFTGHKKDVLSAAFSADNRQIVSGSRDKSIQLWNTLGESKFTIDGEGSHSEWVSCVRFSPNDHYPLIVSAGWDKVVKVWHLSNCKLRTNLLGHTGYLNTVAVSPDGSLCASGGKDGYALLWDLSEGKCLSSLPAGCVIYDLKFSPDRYWLCAATSSGVKIWDLESKNEIADLNPATVPDFFADSGDHVKGNPECISINWSTNGRTLFAGYTDGMIRVFE